MKNSPVFSQLDVCNFFLYIITDKKINPYSVLWEAVVQTLLKFVYSKYYCYRFPIFC